MATIQQVADHAGVSRSTVSRVINEYPHVRPEVREKVLRSISELNYRPNRLARSLRRQQSNSVGVVVRQQKTPFSSELGYSIENILFRNGYHSLLCSTDGDYDKETEYVDMLIDLQVTGVILRPSRQITQSPKNIEKLLDNDIHVVVVDVQMPDTKVSQVLSQNTQGGYDGVNYLVSLGHRHIAIIAPEIDRSPKLDFPGNLRIRGIQRAFSELEEVADPVYLFSTEASRFDNGYFGAKQLLKTHPQITAIFTITDMVAIGVMHAARELGIQVPDDLSVLGYDGIPISSYVIPQLSTMAQPITEMGEMAARTLLDLMNEDDVPIRSIILENRLHIRGSTAPPRIVAFSN